MIEPSLAILARKYDNEQRRNGGGKKGNRRGGGNRSRNACDGAGCLAQQGTSGRSSKGKGLAQVGSEALEEEADDNAEDIYNIDPCDFVPYSSLCSSH